ncbi:small redox-active disulfide protein 2 [Streptohalobacillus salinus]|uniref:Small redox-active disulfide protein 2 n=1 Tax=Streptohalobacillus salinus TaxID=621096 RepID=A0A2V3WGZ0_9BACI|nr:thioredoxin family protein [Streptohalobacillus salinus]PXW93119.1 small redox-active disulfide protein 2 [Streptohalobacillus salinus]
MKIQILGPGCKNCKKLQENTEKAVAALGIDATIEKVEDFAEIARFGVLKTPGLVVDGEVLISGKVPAEKTIKALLAKE